MHAGRFSAVYRLSLCIQVDSVLWTGFVVCRLIRCNDVVHLGLHGVQDNACLSVCCERSEHVSMHSELCWTKLSIVYSSGLSIRECCASSAHFRVMEHQTFRV